MVIISLGVKNLHQGGSENISLGVKNLHQGDENISPGGDEIFSPHITTAYLKDTAAAPEQADSKIDPPTDTGTAAAFSLTPDDLRQSLEALDKRLTGFDKNFYPKAAGFLSHHKLDLKYLEWLHGQCENKEPGSFNGYFFSVFFLENKVEMYKALNKPQPPPPPENVKCPACGAVHEKNIEMCPGCSLPKDSSPIQISLFRELLTFPAHRRNEYLKRENVIYSEFKGDFAKLKKMTDALKKEFNLEVNYEKPSRNYHSRL